MRQVRLWLAFILLAFLGSAGGFPVQPTKPSEPDTKTDEPDAEEVKDRAIAERFRRVLESNPRRGTALDRLYGYHVERGLLDKLVTEYTDRTKKDSKDGVAWTILGLLESQRGRDAAAVAAFRQAEASRPGDAIPPYYLGLSLILVGQPDAAAEAFERAINCKPNRNDLLDIFQALGRVYQRAQRTDKALDVWNRLEKLFPDDVRVQEQIATTQIEEGQFEQALPRLVKLAEQTEDKYRQSALRMDIADLKVKLKRTPEALEDFEKLLGELNPDSWLYRDVRRRTEDVFLRNDDLAGLAKYYEKWLDKHPTDVDAIARLAKTLATQGRAPEAKSWLSKGVTAAPSHRSLRLALIEQYVAEQDYKSAAREYEAMDKAEPNNPDTLREWGKLLLRDTSRSEAERTAAAVAVWKHLLDKKPNDPVVASQVADLVRTAGAVDEAIALYKKAINLAPNAAQYREYLGEYYHSLKRSEEALAAWRPIAEGPNRTSKNLARLAEVLAGFGYRKEAVVALADAISLEKDDFTLRMTYAELLHQENRNDEALAEIAAAARLTSNPEEVEQVLLAQLKVFQATDTLGDRINELQKELDAGKDVTAERWLRLARYYEANRQADRASETVARALDKDARSIPTLIAAARIYEMSGNLLTAAEVNRKLAALDRRYRSEYLTTVAKLEQRLGRREQALQAARDLLAASPGNPEVYKFFADLCFQLGDQEEGLEALRRSVRANPSDPQGLIVLANALAERIRQGEAIELLWRAFEKTNELDAKLGVVDRITQLYLENNQFDRLLERLERERREADKAREITLCIAQAYATAGDLGTARQQLERLLTENNRDTHLLGQLGALCEQEGDLAAAVKYQRQLNIVAPDNYDHQLRLAQLLTRTGEADEAADIWVRLTANETEPHRNLSAIDSLLTASKFDAAVAVLSRMLARHPGNWELLYREGAALAMRGKLDEAAVRFNALLAMNRPDDELSEIAKYKIKQAKKPQTVMPQPGQPQPYYNPYQAANYDEWNNPPLIRRTANIYQVRTAVGMDPRYYYGSGIQPFFAPSDFGQARLASLGWLYERARSRDQSDAYVKQLKTAREKAGPDTRPLWDWYYFQTLRFEKKALFPVVLALSRETDPAGLLALLQELGELRGTNQFRRPVRGPGDNDKTPPLPADQLDHALACYRKLKQVKPDWATSKITAGLLLELRRAKRVEEENTVYREMVREANTLSSVKEALPVAAERKDVDTCVDLFTRLERLQPPVKNASTLSQLPSRQTSFTFVMLMSRLSEDKRFEDVRKVLDLYLGSVRRQNMSAQRASSSTRRPQPGGTPIQLYSASRYGRPMQLEYPSPNEYFDQTSISLLYNAFELHKKADLVSDLVVHLQKQLAAAKGAEKLYVYLAIGYLHWWGGDKDEALTVLSEAVQAAPTDHNLLLEVAALRERNHDYDAALTLLESITPLDTQIMQRREEAVLRLAERTGNLERARQAADRLFGLRLDSDQQLELAGKMHSLGLHALAETVLNRAQRQSGSKTATLVRLMTQYQSQNQTEQAVQIARQILRKAPTVNPNPYRGSDENDMARSQAVGVLARSGNLKEMIERAEAQMKASPHSLQIHQALAGYYQAAGDKEKLKATLLKMAELKPDDGKLRNQIANQLIQAGERDAGLDQYKAAIKLDPSVLAYNYWQVQNLFSQADRFEELGQVFDEIDLHKVGNVWYVTEPIAALLSSEQGQELGLKLFKKAWEAFPQARSSIMSQFSNDRIWRLPEIYVFAKEGVIPREDSDIDPWRSVSSIMNSGNDGRVDTVLTKMLSITRKQQRLPELRVEVANALAKRPDWTAGKALLAVIDIQSGDKERGKREWQEAFDNPKEEVPATARFVFAQELEFYAGCEELAVKTLEAGIDDLFKEGYSFNWGPARRLVWWYQQLGRTEDARKLLLRLAARDESSNPGWGGWWQYQIVTDGIAIAQILQSMGEPVEAVRVYSRLLSDKETLKVAAQYGGDERLEQQVENGLRSAIKSIRPAILPAAVNTLLTPRQPTATDKSVLDLVILVESQNLAKATVSSLFANAFKSTEKSPEIRRAALAKLAELAQKHPTDFTVQTAVALAAFAEGKPEASRAAVDRLLKLVESTTLEPLPPNGKANARQRAEAMAQVSLWLVARECLGKGRETFWKDGEKLAGRAAAAAKRQQDLLLATAILREWGQIELDRGDKIKAESRWKELLELAVPRPATRKSTAAPAPNPAFVSTALQVPVPPAAAPARASDSSSSAPVLTAEQFEKAYQIATLAADKGMAALSLKAMREAVRGGPPVVESKGENYGGSYQTRIINGVQYLVSQNISHTTDVDQALASLVPKWKKLKAPPADVYETLTAAVLPEGRPAEVFLYNEGQTFNNVYKMVSGVWTPTDDPVLGEGEDHNLAELLIRVAVDAGKTDDLRKRVEARAKQPLSELPAALLLTTLALKTKDEARATQLLESLGERVKKDSLESTNNRIATVLIPAFSDPKYAKLLAPTIEKMAENHIAGNNISKAVDLRFKLAQYHLSLKDEAAARAQFKAVEGFGKEIRRGAYDPHVPLAKEYLKIRWVDDALRELGVYTDSLTAADADPRGRQRRTEPTFDEFPRLVRLLLEMPADKRYAALKTWSLPTADRKSVRYFVGVMPDSLPPPAFVKLPPLPTEEVVSTMQLLTEAARESGKLDELTAETEKLAGDKVENADLLRVLALLAQKKGKQVEPEVKTFAENIHKRLVEKPEARLGSRYYQGEQPQQITFRPSELLFASLCLGDPALAPHGEPLLSPLKMVSQWTQYPVTPPYIARIQALQDRLTAARAGAPNATTAGVPARWQAAPLRSIWFAQDDYLAHLSGSESGYLLFDKPLSGTFEFSVDAWQLSSGNGSIGYGGVVFAPPDSQGQALISAVGGTDRVFRFAESIQNQQFSRLTVRVSPGKVQYLVNGKRVYEDTDFPPTAPWPMLVSGGGERTVFRNFAFAGKPEVLSEVKLTGGDFFDGWTTSIYGGVLPARMARKEPERREATVNPGQGDNEESDKEPVYDWLAKDGELLGRKLDLPGDRASPDCLSYFRPLRSGESVRYEFFYEPGKTHVHPSLGRLAFLLDSEKNVRLHWMTRNGLDDWLDLPADNAIDDATGRRGKVSLKAEDWNAVTLTVTADGVKIELNGARVYESSLSPLVEPTFGLFHYRDQTAVRVRNVVLTGPWTKEVGTAQEVTLTAKPATPAVAVARRRLLGERYFAAEAGNVVAQGRKLPAAERYRLLADWVLPNELRPEFQLAGQVTPRDVLGVVDQKQQPEGQRVLLGGQFVAPCLEMIAAAKECGALDDLCARIAKASPTTDDPLFQRSRLALLAVARSAQGRHAEAAEGLRKLAESAAKMPVDAPGSERWPDLIAVLGTVNRPTLLADAKALAQAENKNIERSITQERPFEERDWWLRAFRAARVRAEVTVPPAPLVYWTPQAGLSAQSRSQGWDVPLWTVREGTLIHYPGHDHDYLILRAPLQGDFEVTCGLDIQGWNAAQVRYGAYEFDLNHDRKKYKLHTTMQHEGRLLPINPPLPPAKETMYQFRLTVKDGWFRAFVDGREIAAEKIGANPDPWLMLHAPHANTAEIRDLKITGNPTVPEKINLLIGDDLGMWRPYHGNNGQVQQSQFPVDNGIFEGRSGWSKRGEEMYEFGKKPEPPEEERQVPPRNFPESAIFYQRPFVENGAVEYEFFYDPEKAHVHPALDRTTFLLEPDGVKLHWLTDGSHEKSTVPFDNAKDEPGCRRGQAKLPLKAKEWNKVRLTVKGDTVTLTLNDTLVYERPIESTNQRLFGLFHYTDRTEARVRGLILTGDWPRQLPAEKQLLEHK